MEAQRKLLKLLETATHSSATDGERLSALTAFRKISDRLGGIEAVFAAGSNDALSRELVIVRTALQAALAEIKDMKAERAKHSATRSHNEKASARPTPLPPQSEAQVLATLTSDWQELHRIHENAKNSGYVGDSKATLTFLEILCANGKAQRREAGNQLDASGVKRWHAQAWRLKSIKWFR